MEGLGQFGIPKLRYLSYTLVLTAAILNTVGAIGTTAEILEPSNLLVIKFREVIVRIIRELDPHDFAVPSTEAPAALRNLADFTYFYDVLQAFVVPLRFVTSNCSTLRGTPSQRNNPSLKMIMQIGSSDQSEFEIEQAIAQVINCRSVIKNKDYFLFVSNEMSLLTNLLHGVSVGRSLILRVKYKVFINICHQCADVTVHSVCISCEMGKPVLISVQSTEKLFPSYLYTVKDLSFPVSVVTKATGNQVRKINGTLVPFKTGGQYLRCFLEIANHFNFTYKLFASDGGGLSGTRMPNGTWNGMFGDVLYQRATLGTIAGPTIQRLEVVDMTVPFDYLHLVFVHATPRSKFDWHGIFTALEPGVWLCLAVCTLSVTIIWCQLNRTSDPYYGADWNVGFSAFFIINTYFNQVCRRPKGNLLVQMFIFVWFFFVLVVTTMYLSCLYGLFIAPYPEITPSSLETLADSDYRIGMTFYGGAVWKHFERSHPGSAEAQIFKRLQKMTSVACHKAALQEKFACIAYDTTSGFMRDVYFASDPNSPTIIIRKTSVPAQGMSLVVEKDCILLDGLNWAINHIFEAGMVNLWSARTRYELKTELREKAKSTMKNKVGVNSQNSSSISGLNLMHLKGIMYVFIVSTFLSFFILCCELLAYKVSTTIVEAFDAKTNVEFLYLP